MSDIIDLNEVMERVQGDKELLLELFEIFVEDFQTKRDALNEAQSTGDLERIKEVAHSLKGASGNIAAKSMHQNCLVMESLAKDGKIDEIKQQLTALDEQFEQLKANIEKIKADFSS